MVKKTISLPDSLYTETVQSHNADRSFSSIVQDALREYNGQREAEA